MIFFLGAGPPDPRVRLTRMTSFFEVVWNRYSCEYIRGQGRHSSEASRGGGIPPDKNTQTNVSPNIAYPLGKLDYYLSEIPWIGCVKVKLT
jgi:hypothetical protein